MTTYIEAAAACDLDIIRKSPVEVDVFRIKELAAKRELKTRLSVSATPTDVLCGKTESATTQTAQQHGTENLQARAVFREIWRNKEAMALFPEWLQKKIEDNSTGESVPNLRPRHTISFVNDTTEVTFCEEVGEDLEKSFSKRESVHDLSTKSVLLRVGDRRYTIHNSDVHVSPWKGMQMRLGELKLQTLLQTISKDTSGEPVYRVVLTGGPCAGKSSGMVLLRNHLQQNGYNVFCVPEAATILIEGGGVACFKCPNDEALFRFQLALLETQLALEDAFQALAKACDKKAVLLCDRGSMDGRAFCTEKIWNRILEHGEWTNSELRDGRYDLVLHLVTAADGAATFYNCENNSARTETAEEAIAQDAKLQAMWTGHPKLKIIDNSTSFHEKLSRAVHHILQLVGINTHPGRHCYYHLKRPIAADEIPFPTTENKTHINFLRGSRMENSMKVIHRIDGKSSTYTYVNHRVQIDQTFKTERNLSHEAYNSLITQVDPRVPEVTKQNLCFIYACQHFELGSYCKPISKQGTYTLTVETLMDVNGKELPVNLPLFLEGNVIEVVRFETVC